MNRIVFFSFFLFLFYSTKAQDKIISINKDTIHCAIVSINNERIYYEINNNDGTVIGKSIPLSQVAEYSASQKTKAKSKMSMQETPKPGNVLENHLCLELNSGYSIMPWYLDYFMSSGALPEFYNKLKTGIHINAGAYYWIDEFWGLGLDYSFFRSGSSGSMPGLSNTSVFLMGSEKYLQYVNYFGGSLLFRQHLGAQRRFIISESFSAGVMFFRLEYQNTYPSITQFGYTDVINNVLLTGKNISCKLGVTAEYKLFKSISVGLGGGFILGSIKKASIESKGSDSDYYSVKDQKLTRDIKLSRIDYSFVLRYYF
jgi:hypothetical protein